MGENTCNYYSVLEPRDVNRQDPPELGETQEAGKPEGGTEPLACPPACLSRYLQGCLCVSKLRVCCHTCLAGFFQTQVFSLSFLSLLLSVLLCSKAVYSLFDSHIFGRFQLHLRSYSTPGSAGGHRKKRNLLPIPWSLVSSWLSQSPFLVEPPSLHEDVGIPPLISCCVRPGDEHDYETHCMNHLPCM